MHAISSDRRARLLPTLRPEGIRWRAAGTDRVSIRIDLENPWDEPTEADDLVVEAAPLGAFVPFATLTRAAVPELAPGERRRVDLLVPRRALERLLAAGAAPLGAFGPSVPVTGAAAGALAPGERRGVNARVPRRALERFLSRLVPSRPELLSSLEWMGNLNVYFDRSPKRAVEVHRGFGLRITAGRCGTLVVVLPPDRTRYGMEVLCFDPDWRAEIVEAGWMSPLLVQSPSRVGSRADVVVRVTRLSDSKCVPVELAFETVEGRSDRLGCVQA